MRHPDEIEAAVREGRPLTIPETLSHMHEDLMRIEGKLEHNSQGIGLVLAALHPDNVEVTEDAIIIRLDRSKEMSRND